MPEIQEKLHYELIAGADLTRTLDALFVNAPLRDYAQRPRVNDFTLPVREWPTWPPTPRRVASMSECSTPKPTDSVLSTPSGSSTNWLPAGQDSTCWHPPT